MKVLAGYSMLARVQEAKGKQEKKVLVEVIRLILNYAVLY